MLAGKGAQQSSGISLPYGLPCAPSYTVQVDLPCSYGELNITALLQEFEWVSWGESAGKHFLSFCFAVKTSNIRSWKSSLTGVLGTLGSRHCTHPGPRFCMHL